MLSSLAEIGAIAAIATNADPPKLTALHHHFDAVTRRMRDIAQLSDDLETDLGLGAWQDDASIDLICDRLMDAVSDFLTWVAPGCHSRVETTDELAFALQERAETLRREPPE